VCALGAFGVAWDDAIVARWSADPLGMLWPEMDAPFERRMAIEAAADPGAAAGGHYPRRVKFNAGIRAAARIASWYSQPFAHSLGIGGHRQNRGRTFRARPLPERTRTPTRTPPAATVTSGAQVNHPVKTARDGARGRATAARSRIGQGRRCPRADRRPRAAPVAPGRTRARRTRCRPSACTCEYCLRRAPPALYPPVRVPDPLYRPRTAGAQLSRPGSASEAAAQSARAVVVPMLSEAVLRARGCDGRLTVVHGALDAE